MAVDDRVCPECGEPVDERPFCAACGTNVAEAPPERDGRVFAPPVATPRFAGRPLANWGYRVGAFVVDLSLIVLVGVACGSLADALGATSDDAGTVTGVVILGLWLVDSAVIVALTDGQSVGKSLAGTRIVRENGRHVGIGTGLVRDVLLRLFFFIPLLVLVDSLMPLGDKRQSLRDKLVRTRVVQEPVYRARRWVLTGTAVALTGAWIVLAAASGDWESTGTYDAYDRDVFVSGCSDEGTSEADCGCAFDQIKARLPYDDYREADRTSDPDDWAPHTRRVIADAFTTCTD